MKISFSIRYSNALLLVVTLLSASLSLAHQPEENLYQLLDECGEQYFYCNKDRSKLTEFINQVSKIDKDNNSPVWQLKRHIDEGFLIGRADTILEVLEYAENKLDQVYTELSSELAEKMYRNMYLVMEEISAGALNVDMATVSSMKRASCCNDTAPCEIIKVRQKLYVLQTAKFFKDVEFKEDVTIDGDLTVDGTLTVADQVIACDLTIGCNLILPESTDAAHGNIFKDGPLTSFIHNFGTNNTFVGENAGNFTTSGIGQNSGFGVNTLGLIATGFDNTAVGYNALASNANAGQNVAVGSGTLQNLTSGIGVAIGHLALNSNTTGTQNTAIGWNALTNNTTASFNTAVGFDSLSSNVTGTSNTAVGNNSLFNNTTGSFNSAVGASTLSNNNANGNTAFGFHAILSNTTGINNTAVGVNALVASTGTANTALGINAGSLLTSGDNNIYVTNNGVASESNTIRVGTLGTQTACFMQGIFGQTVAVGGLPVEVDATGKLGTVVSSITRKKNVQPLDSQSSAKLHVLEPVSFEYKDDVTATRQIGLIAEQVAQVYPELVVYDEQGQPYSVRYQVLPVLLLQELQKQQDNIEMLAERVAHLEEAIAA